MRSSLLLVALLLAGFGGWKWLVHASAEAPAIVTPGSDAAMLVGTGPVARVERIINAHAIAAAHLARPKLIALTFDDGPYPMYTPLLLDELHALGVPATFFLIGRDAEQWPELTRRIEADGNEIADHTYSHPDLDHEDAAQVRSEILRGRDALWEIVHDPSVRRLMRPPHGRYTLATLRVAQDLGYHVVLWTDDGGDWRTLTPGQLRNHLLAHATAPEIVLLHSGKLATIQALPDVIARFRAAGYQFVTVGRLLDDVRADALNHPLHGPV